MTGVSAFGQQRPVQSLYMFDPMLINPAYAGTQTQLSATAIYRNQWVNLEGAPKTFTSTIHSGFLKNKVGLGIIATADQIGIHNDNTLYGVYSYRVKLNRTTTLSMGLQAGLHNFRSDFSKLTLKNLDDPQLSGVYTQLTPNFGSGLYLRHKAYFISVSVPYIRTPYLTDINDNGVGSVYRQRRYYYLMGGITLPISDHIQWISIPPLYSVNRLDLGFPTGWGRALLDCLNCNSMTISMWAMPTTSPNPTSVDSPPVHTK